MSSTDEEKYNCKKVLEKICIVGDSKENIQLTKQVFGCSDKNCKCFKRGMVIKVYSINYFINNESSLSLLFKTKAEGMKYMEMVRKLREKNKTFVEIMDILEILYDDEKD